RIQVIEGFVDQLTTTGGNARDRAVVARLLAPAAAKRPLELATLERGVLLARDTLGGSLETILEPSPTTFGAANLTANVVSKPLEGFLLVDNRNSRLYGPWVARGGFSLSNLAGLGEQLDFLGAAALDDPRLWFGRLGITLPLGALDDTWLDGARLRVQGDLTRAKPDLDRLLQPGFVSVQDESNVGVGLEVPVIRSRQQNLFLSLDVNHRDSTAETRLLDQSLGTSSDRLLTVTPSLAYDRADRLGGVSLLDLRLRQGVAIDGLTRVGISGPGAPEPSFTLVGGGVQRLQRLGATRWSLFGEAIFQYAFDPLPASERFALGGERLGRGFSPGNTTGDSGYGARLELRRTVDTSALTRFDSGAVLYGFGDWGTAIDRSDRRDGQQWEVLGSAGLGARIDLGTHLTLTPEVARQWAGRPADRLDQDRETRFFVGAVVRF
ncbi:MAG: ShlB/FhaC/HecB family hemolysin secretion/activation protein, partial [Pseudomonadota bacterium]